MKQFEGNIINIYGVDGKNWLRCLPSQVTAIATRLGLQALKPMANLSYHYVASGLQGERPIVLKLGLDSTALQQEAQALQGFAGHGAVALLAAEAGMLLLACAQPGTALDSYFPERDGEAQAIASHVMRSLHQAQPRAGQVFPHISDWLAILDNSWNIPPAYLQQARRLRDQLLLTSGSDVLLHGDLHHGNILQSGDTWLAIDPKGVIGEAAYEAAAFIRNPMPALLAHPQVTVLLANRVAYFATSLGVAEQRIAAWCFVQAVLAWAWALQDNCPTRYWEHIAGIFQSAEL